MTTSCVASFPDRTISRIDSFISTEKSFKVTNREVQFVRLTTRLPPLKEMNRDLPPWMDGCPLIIKSQRYFPRQWITPEHWRLYLLGKPIFTGYVGFQEGIWYRDFYGFHSERVEGETIHRHLHLQHLLTSSVIHAGIGWYRGHTWLQFLASRQVQWAAAISLRGPR